MAFRPTQCPKCAGRMTEGFVVDDHHGLKRVANWYGGKPVSSAWFGLKLPANAKAITSYRCERCGYLENFAVGE